MTQTQQIISELSQDWKHSIEVAGSDALEMIEMDCIECGVIPLTEQQQAIVQFRLCNLVVGSLLAVSESNGMTKRNIKALHQLNDQINNPTEQKTP